MIGFQHTLDCIESITQANSTDEIFALILEVAQELGIEYISVGRLGSNLGKKSNIAYYKTNYTKWHQHYLDKKYVLIDPMNELIKKNTAPFQYSTRLQDLNPDQWDLIKDAVFHGMRDSYVIPIHLPEYHPTAVTFTSRSSLNLDETTQISLEIISRIGFREIIKSITTSQYAEPIKISDRERQILELVSNGKTNWEIGKILSISEFSVRDYLATLSKRLETCNRTHTVTRALQLSLITL